MSKTSLPRYGAAMYRSVLHGAKNPAASAGCLLSEPGLVEQRGRTGWARERIHSRLGAGPRGAFQERKR
jgi:hypothetical protein